MKRRWEWKVWGGIALTTTALWSCSGDGDTDETETSGSTTEETTSTEDTEDEPTSGAPTSGQTTEDSSDTEEETAEDTEPNTTSSSTEGDGGRPNGTGSAKDVAQQLGRDHFLIGMGNDLADDHNYDGAYTLGVTLDLHYAYLVGLPGEGGWTDWNEGGYFVNILADVAESKGVVPMFTLYSMAAWGEANVDVLTNDDYMGKYWEGAKILFERLGEFDAPAVVHFEPDWWAFAQHASDDPSATDVHITTLVEDCSQLPDSMVGMGKCLIHLARTYAPKTLIGFHASGWAGEPEAIVEYLSAIGAADADLIVTDVLDRDAGCFEVGDDPNCTRQDGPWYWDETNQTSPNFHEHLEWVEIITRGLGLPMLWWQVPFGVPSDTPGGAPGHYRDNRVKYIFSHVDEFVSAGGVGAVFGVGAGNQTYIDTDGDQFKNAVTAYFAEPYAL